MEVRCTRQCARLLSLGLTALLTGACASSVSLPITPGDPNKPEEPPPATVSFSEDLLPLLSGTCALSGCHGGNYPRAGLDLKAPVAYTELVGIEASQTPMPRVTPGDPDNSYLLLKLMGPAVDGDQMPTDGPYLSAAQLEMFRLWIVAGAPNN